MRRTIIINESSEKKLFEHLLNENAHFYNEKVAIALNWLNSHFIQTNYEVNNESGLPKLVKGAIMLNASGNVDKEAKVKTLEDVYYMMQGQPEFKHIFSDIKERNKFLWDCISKWA